MKRISVKSIGLLLVVSILLTSTSFVVAAPLAGGPSISPSSGGGTATLTLIPVSKLPGTEMVGEGYYYPQGHTNGDMVFSGSGVQVTGLVGSAVLSMSVPDAAGGWRGIIYQWANGTWNRLATSNTLIEEANNGIASATIYSDGIYALIVTYKDPNLIAQEECPTNLAVLGQYFPRDDGIYIAGIIVSGTDTEGYLSLGKSIKFTIVNISSDSNLKGPLYGRATITHSFQYGYAGYYIAQAWADTPLFYTYDVPPSFTLRAEVNGCYVDANFPEDFTRINNNAAIPQ